MRQGKGSLFIIIFMSEGDTEVKEKALELKMMSFM